MATQKKTADVDYSMQEKIMALYELQKIDSKIDEINKVKGELPLEVQDLEDEMAGMKTRIEHINAEIEELNTLTKQRKREVDQAKIMIGNYKEQQNNVRNNREFDAITKEIEYQELEIELAEKRLKEYAAGVKVKKAQLEEAEALSKERTADLGAKKAELEGIEAETAPLVAEYSVQADGVKEKIDEINKVKGELPLEVQDLEDEMAGMKTRIEHINAEIEELNTLSKQRKREVDQAKIMIGNYKEQQNNVRNNREFDAITKEIEYQELEIELAEKRLKEYSAGVKAKKLQLEEAENLSVERAADLAAKKAELEGIEAETAPLVAEYAAQGERVKEKIDERLLAAYDRIRRNVRNGLAVVTVKRDACGGCFNRIPPQRQVDIRQGKKIIICEYCGRILVADPDETQE